ncbi:hypothetical protein V6N11_022651 [Hibiscus sabdariffa]|uniref:Uncharacterized protein n=1 Tax=Hibiscus sabdariffa TaxID=183260 RepID=A0ABR2TJV4_9ROSI
MKRQSEDVCNQLCPLEHLATGKIEILSQPKVWVPSDTGLQTKFGGGGDDLQEQSAQFTNSIQWRTYKEEDDTLNCGRHSDLAFHGEELKGEALSDKIVGLGTLFAIDSNFHVEQLSNIWKAQHEELNSSQLYKLACPFIVEQDYKCEIDKLNGVPCVTNAKDGITFKNIYPYNFKLLLMDKIITSFHWKYDSCGDRSNSKDVDNFGRKMIQGIRIETTFNIYSYMIANRYTQKIILNLGAAGVIASHVCNQLILHDPNYKIVALDKLEHCSSLKNLDISSLIGRLKVDWCEAHKLETIRTNVVGMLTLVDTCKEHQLLVINYATGATHSLGTEVGFKKEDKPKFIGYVYSKIKSMIEGVLREFDSVFSIEMVKRNLEDKVLFRGDSNVMNVRLMSSQVNIYKRVNSYDTTQRLKQQLNTAEVKVHNKMMEGDDGQRLRQKAMD